MANANSTKVAPGRRAGIHVDCHAPDSSPNFVEFWLEGNANSTKVAPGSCPRRRPRPGRAQPGEVRPAPLGDTNQV